MNHTKLMTPFMFKGCLFLIAIAQTHTETGPVKNHLFKITRNKDVNEIFYNANTNKDGKLNRSDPVEIYWIRKKNGNKKEPLSWLEQKYAYGLKFLMIKDYEARFQFVSLDKKNLNLKKDKKGMYRVFSVYNGKDLEVDHIYLHIEGGSFWFPKISRIEIHGREASGGKIIETIKP